MLSFFSALACVCLFLSDQGGAVSLKFRGDLEMTTDNEDHEVIVPFLSDSEGRFLSYDLKSPSRHARSVDGDRTLYVSFKAFEFDFLLSLERNDKLVAPKATVEWQQGNATHRERIKERCFYRGHLNNASVSSVAVTNCRGLEGWIHSEGNNFFIQPLQNSSRDHKEHVIHRKYTSLEGDTMQWPTISITEEDKSRHKRHDTVRDKNVEVLLTADYSVVSFHGYENIQIYLLTIMNIVNELYHHRSLGAHVNICLVRMVLLDPATSNMVVPGNPSRSLEQVCRWAHDVQTEDLDDTDHHDHAIFLTRIDFGPAGYAPVTGMCHELRSCTLNHEDGFSSAFVVAHETGHVLGMEHDGDGNDCSDETAYGSIMAPLVQATFSRYHWSRCSQMELRQHISDYYCLDDDPFEKDWPKIPEYPGINYSMDEQCTFDFGGGYRLCTAFKTYDPCKQLWCSHPGNPFFCKTKKGPALDGTSCGDRLWCLQGSCQKEHPIAIHGGWSTWTAWEECSRTCDIGIRVRHRTCDNPRPERGGSECKGQSQEFELCNTQDCPDSPVDFRAQQCSVHDIEEILGTTHHWIPHQPEGEKSPCKLQCISREKGDIHRFPGDVIDGTRCSYDNPTNICVLGKCETVGCDRKLQSTKEFDNCGVCDGDGSRCKTIKGTFDKPPRPGNTIPDSDEDSNTEYQEVAVLPKGAWNIEVFETTPSPHYIVLKNAETGVFALKDHGTKEALLHFVEGGTRWTYLRSSDSETLGTKGPLLQAIVVMISPKGLEPSTLAYKYVIHEDLLPSVNNNMIPGGSPDEYIWVMRAWTVCSKSCDGGVQYTRYSCKRKSDDKVMNIRLCNKDERPAVLRRECNIHSCQEARWDVDTWEHCSKTCGMEGYQIRTVRCVRPTPDNSTIEPVHHKHCKEEKPANRQPCNRVPCPSFWRTGAWSKCSVSCGQGLKERQVVCQGPGNRPWDADDVVHCLEKKPPASQVCIGEPCPEETCSGDQSIFCQLDVLSRYCSIPGYQKLCCSSCRRYQPTLQSPSTSTSFNQTAVEESGVETQTSGRQAG
ncbi:A disintegrin and metalloproteinase with thrombospondin motifs 3-like isoform X1 [Branchiostoma floridae x Branchiostoma japonicum]